MTDPGGRPTRGRSTGRALALFVYLWLAIGFVLGTAALLGPVRWVTSAMRARSMSSGLETVAVIVIILVLVAVSAWLAAALGRVTRRGRTPVTAGIIPVVVALAAGASVWLWLTPRLIAGSAIDGNAPEEVVYGAKAAFVFGPYPEREKLAQLKREGFAGVISLLHPAVVPFEPKILRDERRNAREVGFPLIHAPMLPWVASNDASLSIIRKLAEDSVGKYYVHCYLGRDRVLVVKRVIEHAGALAARGRDPGTVRLLSDTLQPWERGQVYELEDELFLVPYPSDREFAAYVAAGAVRHVVAMLDPRLPEENRLLEREREVLTRARVPFSNWPVPDGDGDWDAALALSRRLYDLPRPLAVHSVYTDPRRSRDVRIFLLAMRSLRPADSESGIVIRSILDGTWRRRARSGAAVTGR